MYEPVYSEKKTVTTVREEGKKKKKKESTVPCTAAGVKQLQLLSVKSIKGAP